MINSSLVMPVIAVATVATVIFIALGFLPRPSRATAIWSAGFAIAMVGSYVWLAHEMLDSEPLRALGSALVIAPMPLMWSGLRAYRGLERQFVALSGTFVVVMPVFLVTTMYFGVYGIGFRVLFASTAVFAVLMLVELARLGPHLRDEALPLMAVSAAFLVFAFITIINGVLVANGTVGGADSLQFLRTLNMIGVTVYITCNLVTCLLLTTRAGDTALSPRNTFDSTVRNRLNRAEAASDPWWSLLDIRLDDPDDIRSASSSAGFNAISERFGRDVDAALPADADFEQLSATRFIALVPRAQGGVREVVTDLLERVSTIDDRQPVPIRMSASVGWTQVPVAGYNLDDLIASAAAAAEIAQGAGGNRWERVSETAP